MGKLEETTRRRAKRNQIQKVVLETIKIAGILSIGIVAPNVLGAMHKLGLIRHGRHGELVRRSIDRMYSLGYLKHVRGGLQLTEKGEKYLRTLQSRIFTRIKPLRWDHKWRILIFDIPEHNRKLRDHIRRTLSGNGFMQVQKSVWIYPYDCEDWVNLWKAELKIGKQLLYLIVDSLEGDSSLKRTFGL
ncbi:MAG: hypothetical protein RLZZ416_585 [Candidatus Parcubacteria bacterium]|jgi:DNA-binding transcriptional regulator PaaX